MTTSKTATLIGGAILTIAVFGLALVASQSITEHFSDTEVEPRLLDNRSQQLVSLGGQTLRVTVADTPQARSQGLSGVTQLDADQGMLFVFDEPGTHSFWMKDMNFDLDLLWIDADGRVVHIEENLSPDTYPTAFTSPVPALYVLEVNAGYVAEHDVQIGDLLLFQR